MTSETSRLDRYKLKTIFDGDAVIHTTYISDLSTGQRKKEVKTRWERKGRIGKGGFGVIYLQEKVEGKKQLRAVKQLFQDQNVDWSRELNAMVKVRDVGTTISPKYFHLEKANRIISTQVYSYSSTGGMRTAIMFSSQWSILSMAT